MGISINLRGPNNRHAGGAGGRSYGQRVACLAVVCGALISSTWPGRAQETAAQRHELATNHLRRVAAEISERCLVDVKSLADWTQQRGVLRRQLREMLGLDPLPARTPLRARITGTLDRADYRIEKVVFESLPGLYATGNFYVPKTAAKPAPTILYLCGHAPHPLGAKFNYQDRAAWFASHGFSCLILDTLEFGEVPGIHHGTHDLNMWHWLSLGYTPAGTEVWNAMRAVDYLETRREVDASRIGVTGISGGGAITWYAAAVDERLAVAAPVCSTFTFGSQAAHWRAAGQCDCIYFHNTYQFDFPVVGALIAPRPLLIISGRQDGDFPPDGYHQVFQRAKTVFDLYARGDSDRINEFDDQVGHSDPPQFLRAARNWMGRWLQAPLPATAGETAPAPETAEDLACFERLPADARNYEVHNFLTNPVKLRKPGSRRTWEQRRPELLTQLQAKVFRWFPSGDIPFQTRPLRNTGGWAPRYAGYQDFSFQTELGARVRAQLLSPRNQPGDAPLLIYVKRPGDSIYFMDLDELLPVLGRCTVLILNPRFSETSISAPDYAALAMTAAWTGRTVPSLQVWDVMRAVQWAMTDQKLRPRSISLYGKGEMGILALYAALFDERIEQVILNDPPASHWQGPALLNVLRVTDIPEAAAALAPRQLVSLTKLPATFDYTRAVYRLGRASEKMTEARSLPEALQVWRYSRAP